MVPRSIITSTTNCKYKIVTTHFRHRSIPKMMAQPNYQRLSECFAGAAQECALLQNIPAVSNSQALIDLIGELRLEMRETAEVHTEQFNTFQRNITADIKSLQTDISALQTDITTLWTDITTRMDGR